MIPLNKKTQQDFLNREWVQKLLDAGVDMSDAKYFIEKESKDPFVGAEDPDYIYYKEELVGGDNWYVNTKHILEEIDSKKKKDIINWQIQTLPTYTVSELLYKLHEYIYPTIDGIQYAGHLALCKDAPFYIFYYALKTPDYNIITGKGKYVEDYIRGGYEYPIESLAAVLIQCHQKDIGYKELKDTGNISRK